MSSEREADADPVSLVAHHRDRLKQHAESDRQSAWLARALLNYVEDDT